MSDIIMFEGRTIVLTKITMASVAVNATTNLVLVPQYGAKGAAIATITEGPNYSFSYISVPVPLQKPN